MKLTDEQLLAALSPANQLLIEAEPGSGKTTTLVERAGLLNASRPYGDRRGILCVSFTRAAVDEIRRRAQSRWGGSLSAAPNRVMTIDALFRWVWQRLIQRGEITWFGLRIGEFSDPMDSWGKKGRRVEKNKQRLSVGISGRAASVTQVLNERRTQGFRVEDLHAYEEALQSGSTTHHEIRACVRSVLAHDWGPSAVGSILAERFGHVLVDEAFDCNGDDRELLELSLIHI